MSAAEPWIVDCYLRDATGASAKEYQCQAAVWAHDIKTCRARLDAFLRSTSYRALRVDACQEAAKYVISDSDQARVGALVRAVNPDHLVELSMLATVDAAPSAQTQQLSFKEALLALDHKAAPVFAVLDGAQFDNLPGALFDGDFISRPLYLDRGENDPEQVITAPHMVWLDERTENVIGRPPSETIHALLDLIKGKPAAVFWQCPEGGEALYKHLRGINMVLYPKNALEDWEEPEPEENDGTTTSSKVPETHTMVLFRHADANVLAQVVFALDAAELSRLFGRASIIVLKPDTDWGKGHEYLHVPKPENLPPPAHGILRLSDDTILRMGDVRFERIKVRLAKYLKKVAPEQTESIEDKALSAFVDKSICEAADYGLETEAGFGRWCYLQLVTKGAMGKSPEVHDFMTVHDPAMSPDQRVRLLLRESAKQMGAVA